LSVTSFPFDKITGAATGIEVVQDPYIIQQLYSNLVQSAREELLLFLPTTSAFLREQKIGIIKSLYQAASRGVMVHILTPTEDKPSEKVQSLFETQDSKIKIRHIKRKSRGDSPTDARTKILIVDRLEYLVVELKDDSKETFVEAVRLAIYSSTQSTVQSYLTLFESLWEQTELYDLLEAYDKLQREFVNIAAHELRTPIQPITGMIEILQERFNNEKELKITKNDLDILVRNANRLVRLSSDILEVSRIESNSLKLSKERFDINEMVKDVIEDVQKMSDTAINSDIEHRTDKHIFVEADKTRVFEVITNLLRNAIKFTDVGTIIVKADLRGADVQVDVRDTGKGIDPEIMPRLFTKFVTKSDQGTGLGLYISKNIIEAHGGRIWAYNNKDGKGATFSFTLPLAKFS
jgi:two-component system, OmpR family, sensor histidine kinase VicK